MKQEGCLENISSIVCLMKILYWHINPVYLLPLSLPRQKNLKVMVWKESGQQILFLCRYWFIQVSSPLLNSVLHTQTLSTGIALNFPVWPKKLGLFTTLAMRVIGKSTQYDTERKWTVHINGIYVSIFYEAWAWRSRLRRNA